MTTAEPMTGTQAPTLPPPVPAPSLPVSAAPDEPLVRPLRQATLHSHDARLAVPTYDRSALTPAVVHFSVGGFHRSH